MKEKNTEKESVYGLPEHTECLRDTLMGQSQWETRGLGPILNSAMSSLYSFGPIISFC